MCPRDCKNCISDRQENKACRGQMKDQQLNIVSCSQRLSRSNGALTFDLWFQTRRPVLDHFTHRSTSYLVWRAQQQQQKMEWMDWSGEEKQKMSCRNTSRSPNHDTSKPAQKTTKTPVSEDLLNLYFSFSLVSDVFCSLTSLLSCNPFRSIDRTLA